MRSGMKGVVAACLTILSLSAAFFWPGTPWSARFLYASRRVAARFESKVAAWSGRQPRPISISGRLIGSGAFVESLKGAQVVALESTSGYAALTDSRGRFTLPHLVWYPGASYTLLVTADAHHAKHLKVRAPSDYPQGGVIDAGELRFDEGVDLSVKERPVRSLEYDSENRDYYRKLFEELAAHARTDHQIIDSICKYTATRFNRSEDPFGFKSARQIFERGAPHCSNFAFAMAAITSAGGYPSRTVHTSDTPDYAHTHVAVEVFYADGWRLYDPTYGVFFLNEADAVASYRELRLNPGLMTPEAFQGLKPEVGRSALAWMPGAYGSGLHQIYQADESAFADGCPILR